MSDNFLKNIKKDLARPYSIGTRIPAGRELLASRDVYQLVESYERIENSLRAVALRDIGLCNLQAHLELIEAAIRAAYTYSEKDSELIMLTVSRVLADILNERLGEQRARKGRYDPTE